MKMGMITEPARQVPVIAEVDVAVLGGGPTGVCAAVAAARAGASALLVERYGFFGGVATAGLVAQWHTLYSPDKQVKVIGGLPEEAIDRLEKLGAARYTANDRRDNMVIDTETAKLVYDNMVRESGVKPLLHTRGCAAIAQDGHISEIVVENKSGRGAISASVFVDATGDGDLATWVGAPWEKGGAQGEMQSPGLAFRVAGVDFERFNAAARAGEIRTLLDVPMDYNGQVYPCFLWYVQDIFQPDKLMIAGVRVTDVDCTDAWDLTRAEMESRQQLRWLLKTLREKAPGCERLYLAQTATQLGIRETRRVLGDYLLTEDDMLSGRQFPDVIGQGTYPIDIHDAHGTGIVFKYIDGKMREVVGRNVTVGYWTPDGQPRSTPCYQMPYRSLLPRGCDNLLVAGRCFSTTHAGLGGTRVMVNCMQLGQAAGVGAALAAREGCSPRDVPIGRIQDVLVSAGVPLRT